MDKRIQKELRKIATALLQCPTAPFRESAVSEFIKAFSIDNGYKCSSDSMGNLIVSSDGNLHTKQIAFMAHMDHPGFIVERDSKDGRTTALFYGGWDPAVFKSAPVRIFGKNTSVKASMDGWKKVPGKPFSFRAELSVKSAVKKGDLGMWDFESCRFKKERLHSRACDDLVGCVLMMTLMRLLRNTKNRSKAVFIFTAAEEAGLHGVKHLCAQKRIPPNVTVISVETSKELPVARMDEGVVIRVGDIRTIFSNTVVRFMIDCALSIVRKDKLFRYQRKLMDGGRCEGSVTSEFNLKTGAICIPLGNYHNRNFETKTTRAEYVSLADMGYAVQLMNAMTAGCEKLKQYENQALPRYTKATGALGEQYVV